MKIAAQSVASGVIGLLVFGLLVFWPAGTFDYWQGWTFIAVFAASTAIPSIHLAATNPAALKRRMQAGPQAETRPLQKVIISVAFLSMGATIIVSALDFRFGWSSVAAAVSVAGDVLVAVGQQVVSTGLHAIVRHPMYFGNVALMIGITLALGSYWGLLFVIPGLAVLALRILDEESVLTQQLSGYDEYTQRVHYRLVPYVW